MASRAMASSRQHQPPNIAHAMLLVGEITQPRIVTNVPPRPVYMVETGLRAGIKLEFTPDKRHEFPSSVAKAIEEIKELERLPRGWDSYNGAPLNDDAVVAAFELIIHAESRCDAPMLIVPLPNGGLGLRWVMGQAELEIDVSPDGTCEGTLDSAAIEPALELLPGATLEDAKQLITRHASIR